ncbi:MAG TPA: Ig-like domain-containing protein [Candidatus Aphodovivens excrementavium]|nr:Ig-like domain-containing protein [Candidatus Aphodovivens avicola]HIT44691.1 Ig-like domain-containing protein [Candidatus Aphodovivens excrementavium]
MTWSASDLPAGLTLDADTGAITGIPTTDGQFQVTVTATNSVGSIDRTYTLNIKPATVSVTGLKLDKDSLILQENGSYTLTATVEPADATNKAVTWASSDTNIATVSADGTVTAISAGNATITATAADGSGISASCNLTVTHGNMIQTPKKDATCTVDGTEEYWTCEICGKHYKDESGTIPTTPEENKIQATGHNYENGKCTVCSEVDPAFKAMIIKGANGEWRKGSEDGLFFTSNAAFADFLKVQVDGKDVDSSKYTVEEGSTIVTLNASYLETLSAGKHTLAIVSDTGTAETEFTVVAAEKQVVDDESANDKADNDGDKESLAKTGDDSMLPITALSILAVVSIATGVFALRRSRI